MSRVAWRPCDCDHGRCPYLVHELAWYPDGTGYSINVSVETKAEGARGHVLYRGELYESVHEGTDTAHVTALAKQAVRYRVAQIRRGQRPRSNGGSRPGAGARRRPGSTRAPVHRVVAAVAEELRARGRDATPLTDASFLVAVEARIDAVPRRTA